LLPVVLVTGSTAAISQAAGASASAGAGIPSDDSSGANAGGVAPEAVGTESSADAPPGVAPAAATPDPPADPPPSDSPTTGPSSSGQHGGGSSPHGPRLPKHPPLGGIGNHIGWVNGNGADNGNKLGWVSGVENPHG
jgi:hypothetical protein